MKIFTHLHHDAKNDPNLTPQVILKIDNDPFKNILKISH